MTHSQAPFFSLFPRLAILAFGLWIGATAFYIALQTFAKQAETRLTAAYGQSLVDSAAREAIEATFRNDLISLQATVQSVSQNPYVASAAVVNVDQQTLVQAGRESHLISPRSVTYQSSITMHDSIAGFAVVIIDPTHAEASVARLLYLLSSLFCAVVFAIACWRDARFISNISSILSTRRKTESMSNAPEEGSATDKDDDSSYPTYQTNTGSAFVAVCIKNTTVLKRQLSGGAFRKTLDEFDSVVVKFGELYGLIRHRWSGDRYLLQFSSHDRATALFNAACCTQLILDKAGIINRIPLDLSAQLSFDEENIANCTLPFTGLAIDNLEDAQETLSEKVEYIDISEDDDRKLIFAFSQPYRDLLKKQIAQFQ